jgi:hypothetical protein
MIIRVFRPTIHPGKESEFESFLRDTAIPLVSQQKGVVAQHVVSRATHPQLNSSTSPFGKMWSRSEPSPANAGRRP